MTDKITDLRTHRVTRIAEASEPLGPHPKMGYGEATYLMWIKPIADAIKRHHLEALAVFLLASVGPFLVVLFTCWVWAMIEAGPIFLP